MSQSPLEEIIQRELDIRAKLSDVNCSEVSIPRAFFKEQIGLSPVMCDPIGRFWDVGSNPIRMIFDPNAPSFRESK